MGTTWTVLLLQAAESSAKTEPVPDMKTAFWMYVIGIVAVGLAWTVVPLVFVLKGETKTLVDVLKQGTALRYVTVTYIVLIVVTLALVGKLEGKEVSTLLAGIAGYVLGQSGRQRDSEHAADETKPAKKEHLDSDHKVGPTTIREA